jgi:hypothetical protein
MRKMRVLTCLVAAAITAAAADRGLPARSSPTDYPVHGQDQGVVIGAEVMHPDQVSGSFSTDLEKYAVVEVAIYPNKDGKPLDLSTIDFALRFDGRMVRPAEPWNIARINQKKASSGSRDILLYPSAGIHTGSWGTGTSVGLGVGVGGRTPGPASSDRDREVMAQELGDKALQDAVITKPTAGYLYFPVGSSKRDGVKYELEYKYQRTEIKLALPNK